MNDLSVFAAAARETTRRAATGGNAVQLAEIVRRGLVIADAAAVSDIEMGAARVADHSRWYDVRPMLDEREHSPAIIDMSTEVLAYAEQRGLIERHLVEPHMVRITRQG